VPITGHPDFGSITVRYVADRKCVELKSLKLYFHAFRNEGIFFEAVTNKICDDLGFAAEAAEPDRRFRLEGPGRHHLGHHRLLEPGRRGAPERPARQRPRDRI
jgi:hypothetical protein